MQTNICPRFCFFSFIVIFAYAEIRITLHLRLVSQQVNTDVNHKGHFIVAVNSLFVGCCMHNSGGHSSPKHCCGSGPMHVHGTTHRAAS